MFKTGEVLCLRTTGERVILLNPDVNGDGEGYVVSLRRPTIGESGIVWHEETFYAFELESAESHLRREAEEMYLKAKLQNEMQERLEEEEAGARKKKAETLLVN